MWTHLLSSTSMFRSPPEDAIEQSRVGIVRCDRAWTLIDVPDGARAGPVHSNDEQADEKSEKQSAKIKTKPTSLITGFDLLPRNHRVVGVADPEGPCVALQR